MVGGSSNWLNMENLRPSFQQSSTLLPSSSSLSSTSLPNSFLPLIPWLENQELSESWSQLLLGGFFEEEDRCTFTSYQAKMENWKNQVICHEPFSVHDIGFSYEHANEELHRIPWSTSPILSTTSPKSCATSSSSSLLDFSNSMPERKVHKPDYHSSECNSIITSGATFKKARTQTSSAQSTFKVTEVRKEKLGDRITALHQLVSPFGKTDTASVLLEAIGYIRFLQSQIGALSSPYLVTGSGNMKQTGLHGGSKDLRSRGLCLVPISCTLHCGSENGADYWAPTSS